MKIITILPVSGNGPYGWLKDGVDNNADIDACIADAGSGFRVAEFKISSELEARFREWVIRFEGGARSPGFSWWQFHEDGIALARRLKAEIGTGTRVIYAKPMEDPGHAMESRLEVLGNGKLVVAVRRFTPGAPNITRWPNGGRSN